MKPLEKCLCGSLIKITTENSYLAQYFECQNYTIGCLKQIANKNTGELFSFNILINKLDGNKVDDIFHFNLVLSQFNIYNNGGVIYTLPLSQKDFTAQNIRDYIENIKPFIPFI